MAVQQADALISQAKQARSRNDVIQARSLLSQVIKADPRNEEAWLLFVDVAEKNDHAIYSLEQVLKINPVNMEALDRLNALKAPSPTPVVPITTPPPPATPDRAATPAPRVAARETVILDERMHGAMFILPFLMALVGIVVSLFISSLAGYGIDLIAAIAFLGFMLGALLELARTTVRYFTGHLTLTNKRIVIKRGLFNRQSYEILLKQVEGVGVRQPVLGRIFGFGTIIVTGTGGAREVFRGLRDPQHFREQVQAR